MTGQPPDPWIKMPPWTMAQLQIIRSGTIIHSKQIVKHEIKNFTCDECEDKENCVLVFDAYNTDGDCLLMK